MGAGRQGAYFTPPIFIDGADGEIARGPQYFNLRVGVNGKVDRHSLVVIDSLSALQRNQFQQPRRLFRVLAAKLKLVPDLIKHQIVRVCFLDSVIVRLRRVAGKRPIPIRSKLRFVRVNGAHRLMVDGGDFIDLAPAAVYFDCGYGKIVFIAQFLRILLQAGYWNAAKGYAPDARNGSCAELEVKQRRRLFRVLAVHLKEVAHLIKHHIVGMRRLCVQIVHPPRGRFREGVPPLL